MTIRPYDEACMTAAIAQSQLAVDKGCMPFGAVLADATGTIIVEAHNAGLVAKKRGGSGDVTRHAEMELVRKLSVSVDADIRPTCTIYTSTEPCVMCAGAIYWSGVGRVVYGCSSEELETLSGPGGFDIPIDQLYKMGRPGMRAIDIEGPLLSADAMQVHKHCGVWSSNDSNKEAGHDKDIATERSLFASGLGAAAATRDFQVPVVDMSQGTEEELTKKLWDAAHTVGFFTVVGHGIPLELIDKAFGISSEFFSQSQEDKEKQSPFAKNLNAGYEYYSQVRPSTGTNDQKESLQITAREGVMDGRWPQTPPNFQEIANEFMREAHALACRVLDLMEKDACPLNEPGTLSKSHTLWAQDGQCTVRMLHYPPMDAATAEQLTTPDEEGRIHWRAGPHTDWSNISLLFQRPGQAGLECCSNPHDMDKTNAARWAPVDPVEGGVAINIGDMLARWSDGRLYSNLHRVRMPTAEECSPPSSRYSIAFFAQSDKATMIRSKDSEPMTAGDYLLSRIRSNFEKTPA